MDLHQKKTYDGRVKIPPVLWIFWGLIFCLGLFSENPIHTTLSLLLVPILIKLLWRPQEPPVLFFAVLMQWLSATIKVFVADLAGLKFNDPSLHSFPAQIDKAFFLSLAGVLFFAAGIRFAVRGFAVRSGAAGDLAQTYRAQAVFVFYVFFSFFLYFFFPLTWLFPSLKAALAQFYVIKWGVLFMTAFVLMKQRRYGGVFFLILAFEMIVSLSSSYFSVFKSYLIALFLAFCVVGGKWSFRKAFSFGAIFFIGFNLVILWTYIKPEYRQFLSEGKRAQVVSVRKTDALKESWDLAKTINAEKYFEQIGVLAGRMSYIDFFSASLSYVPVHLPYQNGRFFKEAVMHLLTPRIFFPEKAVMDDSDELNAVTGLNMANAEKGTSIGLGYTGECYVDFGALLMFLPIGFVGLLIGWIYKVLILKSPDLLWGFSFTVPLFYFSSLLEMNMKKIIGGSVMYLIIALLMIKLVVPALQRSLRQRTLKPSGGTMPQPGS